MRALLERDAELSTIDETIGRARDGQGEVVVVTAPSGVGKTSLLGVARSRAIGQGLRVLTARGSDLEAEYAFGIVRQLFERVLASEPVGQDDGLLTGLAAPAAAVFDPAVTVGRGAASTVFPPLNALAWLLTRLAAAQPVAMVVDDVQWADDESLRFLGFMARRIEEVPVALVVAGRPVEAGAEDTPVALLDLLISTAPERRVVLRPLSASAVAMTVRERLGADADEGFCRAVAESTGGNPLFLEELLRVLAAEGVTPTADSVPAVGAAGPAAIGHYTDVRLGRHPVAVRRLAQAVAVLGDWCDQRLAARLSGSSEELTLAHCRALVDEGIFESASPPAFSHILLRDAVRRGLSPTERAAAHDRAAQVLIDEGAAPERIAFYLLLAPPSADPTRIAVLANAADEMRRRGAPQAALVYLRRAVQQEAAPAVRAELTRVLGNAEAYCLQLDEAKSSLEAALRLADGAEQRALCAFSLARLQHATGQTDESVDTLLEAIAGLAVGEAPALRTRLEIEVLGVARVSLRRRQLVIDRFPDLLARRAEARAAWPPAGDVLDAQLAWDQLRSGAPLRVAAETAGAALAGGRLSPDSLALYAAIHVLIVADELAAAEGFLQRALRAATDRGLVVTMSMIHGYLARVAFQRGDVAKAAAHVDTGLDTATDVHFAVHTLQSTLVRVLMEQARLGEAEQVLARSVVADGAVPRSGFHLGLLDARSRLRAVQGRWRQAADDALLSGELYRVWGAELLLDHPWRGRAATALAQLGDEEASRALIDEQIRLARAAEAPRALGAALRTAATLGGSRDVLAFASEAVEVLEGIPARLELAKALEVLGVIQLERRDDGGGRASLQRAFELAVECSATALASRLRGTAPGVGDRRSPAHLSGVLALTAAEGRVARLAADGLSNRQIARQLFVGEKTVEAHLSRIYRKVSVTGREDLRAVLRDAFGTLPPTTS